MNKPKTQRLYKHRINRFLTWYNKDPKQLLKLDAKEVRNIVVKFANDCLNKGIPNNSTLAYVSTVRLFLKENDIILNITSGMLPEPEEAEGYKEFSNGDLGKIFEVASVKYKALIATLASSGWSIDDIQNLDKAEVQQAIKESKNGFAFIEGKRRGKTKAQGLLCLSPLATQWLQKWLKQNPEEKVFPMAQNSIAIMLQNLAKRSGIKGKTRIHNIRKLVISSLIKMGFNTEQWKFITAKKIPISDKTYLQNLTEDIKQKYIENYNKYLNIQPQGVVITDKKAQALLESKNREIAALRQAYQSLQNQVKNMSLSVDLLMQDLEDRRGPQTEPQT